ncbi:GTP-binding protein [Pelagibius sp. Alg239-R121]|uniref:CobW family GTP-binding protein n=1 Tax=Pelagibius sp. Alg239-R121 TaxID=2993448 RepID=UPI0024A77DC1|nr:GTP-binding protein [Pelagibius sp. Alg239-R121]
MESWELDGSSQRLPISVLTGFLGSGKTTILNYLIQQPALSRALVLINEFGEIGLDHDLVAHSKDDVVIEMSSGCLCCTIRSDLVNTLRSLFLRRVRGEISEFDRVVIETTGLADPVPILHTIMTDPLIAARYRLDGVITAVDAATGQQTLDRQIESVKQVAVADRLLITKTDLIDFDALHKLQNRLRILNPAAPRIITEKGAVEPTSLFDAGLYNPKTKSLDVQTWLNAEAYAEPHEHETSDYGHSHQHSDVNRHDAHIKAVCLTIDEPIHSDALDHWLEALLLLRGADFLRIKGLINVVDLDGPVVIHGVQHIFHPAVALKEWPSEDRSSRIVFITRDIDESVLRGTLRMFSAVEPQTPDLLPADTGDRDITMREVRE